MTDKFVPTKFGTHKTISAEADQATEWLRHIIMDNMTAEEQPLIHTITIRHNAEREGEYYSFMANESSKYRHIWRLRNDGYKDARIVVRKDGTVNVGNLMIAVRYQLVYNARQAREKDILTQNIAQWDKLFNCSPRDYDGARIELSKTELGKCMIQIYGAGISFKKPIKIDNVRTAMTRFDAISTTMGDL